MPSIKEAQEFGCKMAIGTLEGFAERLRDREITKDAPKSAAAGLRWAAQEADRLAARMKEVLRAGVSK